MKPLRSPLFIICILLFLVHQVFQKGLHLNHLWLNSYLDNLLAMPIILSLWQLERNLFFRNARQGNLSALELAVATGYISCISEIIFPVLSSSFTSDWRDVFFHAAGAILYYGLNKLNP